MNKIVQKGFSLLFFVLSHMLIHIIIKSFCLFLVKLSVNLFRQPNVINSALFLVFLELPFLSLLFCTNSVMLIVSNIFEKPGNM